MHHWNKTSRQKQKHFYMLQPFPKETYKNSAIYTEETEHFTNQTIFKYAVCTASINDNL